MNVKPAVRKGAELQREIAETRVPPGHAAIWWLGQATFCFKLGESIVYLDPFYQDQQRMPHALQEMPLKPHEFTGASLILVSHDHLDHLDEKTLPGAAAASPQAPVCLPSCGVSHALDCGVPGARLRPMRGDDSFTVAGIKITAIPAAHETLTYTDEHGYHFLGYVIEGNGVTLYHSGDTQPYPGWYERMKPWALDIAFLPISHRDNLHYTQAVYFCALHQPRLVGPMHFGMFPDYTEDPIRFLGALRRNVPAQRAEVLQVGLKFCYPSGV